jgi:hypothetical protein
MEITARGLVTLLHGMVFGGFFLMAIYGLGLEACRSAFMKGSPARTERGYRMEHAYLTVMAGVGWIVVLSGAYIIYPWYRAVPPAGITGLSRYPQHLLMSSAATSGWHTLGMEWKEHIAWMAAISMTVVAYLSTMHGTAMEEHAQIRMAIRGFILTALLSAGIAGAFGAMLNKYAPIQGDPNILLMRVSK